MKVQEPNGTRGVVLLVLVALMLTLAIGAVVQQGQTNQEIFLGQCLNLCESRYAHSEEFCECSTWCCDAYSELAQ